MKKLNTFKYYLQLLEVFTIREIKSRYRASLLGFLWIVLYPLILAFILNFIFGRFVKINTHGIPYFLFVLSGILFWNIFQQSVSLAKESLVWNRDLVTKTSFPKNTLPLSYVFSKIPDFFVNCAILLFFYFLSGYEPHTSSFFIFLLIIPLFLFSAGISLAVSLANAVFRDFGRITELFLLLLFYATPIVYPDFLVPGNYKFFLLINPLSSMILFTRELLFRNNFRVDLFSLSLILSLFIFGLGFLLFRKFEKKMADLI